MGQLTITLPDNLEDEVRDKVQQGKYGSVSDFVRDAIKSELSYRPTYWERFISANVLENNKLLRQLTKTSNETWGGDELLLALQRGYADDYIEAENFVSHDELPNNGTTFVRNVLEMFGELQRGYDEYGKGDKELGKRVEFEGFDGNASDGYLGYVNFLVDNGKFTYVRPLDKMPHLNSHSMVVEVYGRMLDEYKVIKANRPRFEYKVLSLDEVKQIVEARKHPDYRNK